MYIQEKVEGLIEFYKLQEWWFLSFTPDERKYIDNRYQPMGAHPHILTQGTILKREQPAPQFLNGLNSWFRRKDDVTIAERIHQKLIDLAKEYPIDKPGYYDGRHFTTYVRDFEALKKKGVSLELENLLIELVNATEAESTIDNIGVAPAYYNELAILYRKQKDYVKEISILERFAKQKHARGVMPAKLLVRLDKVKKPTKTSMNPSG